MAIQTVKIFKFHCLACGTVTTAKCRRCGAADNLDPMAQGEKMVSNSIPFSDGEWKRLVAHARATPWVRSPLEFIRLAVDRALSRPPQRLIALQRTKTPSKRH
jgi:hypothetical protein